MPTSNSIALYDSVYMTNSLYVTAKETSAISLVTFTIPAAGTWVLNPSFSASINASGYASPSYPAEFSCALFTGSAVQGSYVTGTQITNKISVFITESGPQNFVNAPEGCSS